MALLRRDIPSLKLWAHRLNDTIYLALDQRAANAVNGSSEFASLHSPASLLSIRLFKSDGALWRLAHTDPMAMVVFIKPSDLDLIARTTLTKLELVLRRLGLQFDSPFFTDTCGERQLGLEQRRLIEIFHLGKWLMLEAETQMCSAGFPPAEDPAKYEAVRAQLLELSFWDTHTGDQKRRFFSQLITHGFNNLQGPPTP